MTEQTDQPAESTEQPKQPARDTRKRAESGRDRRNRNVRQQRQPRERQPETVRREKPGYYLGNGGWKRKRGQREDG